MIYFLRGVGDRRGEILRKELDKNANLHERSDLSDLRVYDFTELYISLVYLYEL